MGCALSSAEHKTVSEQAELELRHDESKTGPAGKARARSWLGSDATRAFILLFGILNLAYFPALWGGRTLMASAATVSSVMPWGAFGKGRPDPAPTRSADPAAPGWQFESAVAFQHRELMHGRFPSWNPYVGYGAPWAANMLPQPLFPLTFLLSLHPSPKTISWFLVARLLLGGWFAYLFLRRLLSHSASVIGAVVFALQGYFIINLNIDHLSTEVLIPMVFWAFEALIRDRGVKSRLSAVIAIVLSVLSGMPESTFLILLFGYIYFLFRLATDSEARAQAGTRLFEFAAVNAIAFAACAFLLLPFLELLHNGIDSHRTSITGVVGGLLRGPDLTTDLLYLLPFAFGPFTRNIFTGYKGLIPLWNYVGMAATVLGIYAVASCLRRPRTGALQQWFASFFAVAVSAMLLKYHGHPAVNWIGGLPLFDMILYPKYLQPLIGFGVACLSACGAAELFEGRVSVVRSAAGPLAVLVAILALAETHRTALHGIVHAADFYAALVCGLTFLMVLGAAITWCASQAQRSGGSSVAARTSIGVLVAMESLASFLVPTTYVFSKLPPDTYNPYEGAPYVRVLQERSRDGYRVFGQDAYLHPNWASAFGLYDVRYIYGINYDRFMHFIRALLAPPDLGLHGDLADRFTGTDYPYAASEQERQRFLQLSSIRYLIRGSYMGSESPLITAVLSQNGGGPEKKVVRTVFRLGEDARDVLFQHPPSSRIRVTVTVPEAEPMLAFTPAIDPALTPGCGDGVTFKIEVESARGIEPLYEKYIDPKADPAAQRWNDDVLDLRAHAGRPISLLLSTDGGPQGSTACDWAGWGGLRFTRARSNQAPAAQPAFRLIHDAEAKIYEYGEALPRAAVFSAAIVAKGPDEALARIKDPTLDVWRKVVVESGDSGRTVESSLAEVASQPPDMARPATIESYESQRVTVRADASRPSILLLNDANYPGWKAFVDGKRSPLLYANYLFRGVLLPPGTHRVEFRYEPASYRYGSAISLAALAAFVLWWRLDRRRRIQGSAR